MYLTEAEFDRALQVPVSGSQVLQLLQGEADTGGVWAHCGSASLRPEGHVSHHRARALGVY